MTMLVMLRAVQELPRRLVELMPIVLQTFNQLRGLACIEVESREQTPDCLDVVVQVSGTLNHPNRPNLQVRQGLVSGYSRAELFHLDVVREVVPPIYIAPFLQDSGVVA